MKRIFWLILFFVGLNLFRIHAQNSFSTSFNSSYNRIGFAFDVNAMMYHKNNLFSVGLLYYGSDYLFEKNSIGGVFRYGYEFKLNKAFIRPQIKLAFIPEKKIYNQLLSNDFQIQTAFGKEIVKNISLTAFIGTGLVLNLYKTEEGKYSDTHYMNYEIGLGIQYNFIRHNN